MSTNKNQGEGDKASARRYNDHAAEFVAEGKVDQAARTARDFVETEPAAAVAAERTAQRGPGASKVSLEDLMARGRTVVDRMRPMIERAAGKLRAKFTTK